MITALISAVQNRVHWIQNFWIRPDLDWILHVGSGLTRHIGYGWIQIFVCGPSVWNDLPPTLRASSTTFGQFQNKLKTVLFCSEDET